MLRMQYGRVLEREIGTALLPTQEQALPSTFLIGFLCLKVYVIYVIVFQALVLLLTVQWILVHHL